MKKQAVQGYTMALSFLNMYESDGNALTHTQKHIQLELSKIVTAHIKKHRDLFKITNQAWDKCLEITNNDAVTVDALTFAVQMVIKNPNQHKHSKLTNLAIEANKEFLFKSQETIKDAKFVVNKFYGRGA